MIAKLEEIQFWQMATHSTSYLVPTGLGGSSRCAAMGGITSWTAGAAPTVWSQSEGFFSTSRA
jgi:hypothetical protein